MTNIIYTSKALVKNIFFNSFIGKLALFIPAMYMIFKVVELSKNVGL